MLGGAGRAADVIYFGFIKASRTIRPDQELWEDGLGGNPMGKILLSSCSSLRRTLGVCSPHLPHAGVYSVCLGDLLRSLWWYSKGNGGTKQKTH